MLANKENRHKIKITYQYKNTPSWCEFGRDIINTRNKYNQKDDFNKNLA